MCKTRTLSALIRKPMLAATDTFDVRGHRMHKERKRKRPHRLKVRRAVGDIRARQTKHVDRGRVHLHEHRRVDLSNQPQQRVSAILFRTQPLSATGTCPSRSHARTNMHKVAFAHCTPLLLSLTTAPPLLRGDSRQQSPRKILFPQHRDLSRIPSRTPDHLCRLTSRALQTRQAHAPGEPIYCSSTLPSKAAVPHMTLLAHTSEYDTDDAALSHPLPSAALMTLQLTPFQALIPVPAHEHRPPGLACPSSAEGRACRSPGGATTHRPGAILRNENVPGGARQSRAKGGM